MFRWCMLFVLHLLSRQYTSSLHSVCVSVQCSECWVFPSCTDGFVLLREIMSFVKCISEYNVFLRFIRVFFIIIIIILRGWNFYVPSCFMLFSFVLFLNKCSEAYWNLMFFSQRHPLTNLLDIYFFWTQYTCKLTANVFFFYIEKENRCV